MPGRLSPIQWGKQRVKNKSFQLIQFSTPLCGSCESRYSIYWSNDYLTALYHFGHQKKEEHHKVRSVFVIFFFIIKTLYLDTSETMLLLKTASPVQSMSRRSITLMGCFCWSLQRSTPPPLCLEMGSVFLAPVVELLKSGGSSDLVRFFLNYPCLTPILD